MSIRIRKTQSPGCRHCSVNFPTRFPLAPPPQRPCRFFRPIRTRSTVAGICVSGCPPECLGRFLSGTPDLHVRALLRSGRHVWFACLPNSKRRFRTSGFRLWAAIQTRLIRCIVNWQFHARSCNENIKNVYDVHSGRFNDPCVRLKALEISGKISQIKC